MRDDPRTRAQPGEPGGKARLLARIGKPALVAVPLAMLVGAGIMAFIRPTEDAADGPPQAASAQGTSSADAERLLQLLGGPLHPVFPDNPGYVGIEACVDCHRERVEQYRSARHYWACRQPEPSLMPPGFQKRRNECRTRWPDVWFEATRVGDRFEQVFHWQNRQGKWRSSRWPIDLVYGLRGGTDEVYFRWSGERVWELPAAWLHPLQRWGAASFDPFADGQFARPASAQCLECHNTWVPTAWGEPLRFRRAGAVLSIHCESCHGPAARHVAFHREHPDERESWHIVRPASLSRERQIDICAHCHANSVTHAAAPFSFRPGEPLYASFKPFRTRYPEQDHVANQVTYLLQSRCYRESPKMTCTTCHDPHRPRSPTNAGSASCLQCHAPRHCAARQTLPVAVRDACVDCHMPSSFKIQVSFRTDDDDFYSPVRRCEHRIAIYPLAHDTTLLRWFAEQDDPAARRRTDTLRGAVARALSRQIDESLAEHRHLAAIALAREALRLPLLPRDLNRFRSRLKELVARQARIEVTWQRALHELAAGSFESAERSLREILTWQPTYAGAHGRLGTVLAQLGRIDEARAHLEKVATLDPMDSYGESMLGWISLVTGQPQQAAKHFRRAAALTPWDERIHLRLAMALAQTGDLDGARRAVQTALRIAPQSVDSLLFASRVALQTGSADIAYRHAIDAARLGRCRNAQSLLILCDAAIATAHLEVARRALDVAATLGPDDEASFRQQVARRAKRLRSAQLPR